MEVILRQDIQNLGYAHEIVKVKDGYARNYLIPQGLAVVATETNKKVLAEDLKQKAFKEAKTRTEAETMQKALNGLTVKIGAKAAETGKIYGSVNNIQIAGALKEQHHFEIDRRKISIIGDTIKELGTYTAEVSIYKDIKVKINLEVTAE